MSHSPGIILAAIPPWIPPALVLIDRAASSDLPATVPLHWNGSLNPDAWYPVGAAFWMTFLPGVIGAVLITLVIASSGDDVSRFGGSAALAGGTFVTGGIAFAWFAALAAAVTPAQSPSALLQLLLWAALTALLVFVCGALPRTRGRGASNEPVVRDRQE
ncbi:hypothetical protein [Microbacterium luticocti]|uniref:hypothetical protein n=1 Tax=Microbacterium luticocti TaxID=451764 RepID=UPI0012EB1B88|nr:hypothetical protein [Microbacterium luticocti]